MISLHRWDATTHRHHDRPKTPGDVERPAAMRARRLDTTARCYVPFFLVGRAELLHQRQLTIRFPP